MLYQFYYRGLSSTTNWSVIKLMEISSSLHHERSGINQWCRGVKINLTAFYGTLICQKVHLFRPYGCFGYIGCAMFSAKRFGSRHVWHDDIWGVRSLMRAHWVTLYLVWLACVARYLAWRRLGCAPLSRAEPCKAAISGAEVGYSPILYTTLYRNLMQAPNFGVTFDQLFLWIF